MRWLGLLIPGLIAALPARAPAQPAETPFSLMMAQARTGAVVEVDAVAGSTRILMASGAENPRFVLVHAEAILGWAAGL